jgi:hypothetical protein
MVLLLFTGPTTFDLDFNYLDNRYEDGSPTGKGKLYAIMFHTFCFMQLFNEINCRRVGVRDFNVFFNIKANWIFALILAGLFFF